jgi:hypothetical protein
MNALNKPASSHVASRAPATGFLSKTFEISRLSSVQQGARRVRDPTAAALNSVGNTTETVGDRESASRKAKPRTARNTRDPGQRHFRVER